MPKNSIRKQLFPNNNPPKPLTQKQLQKQMFGNMSSQNYQRKDLTPEQLRKKMFGKNDL